jgi:hypothetical protein
MDGSVSDAVSSKKMTDEMCVIEALLCVNKLSRVPTQKDKTDGFGVSYYYILVLIIQCVLILLHISS